MKNLFYIYKEGIVEKIGPGVKTVKDGDHVVLHWRPSTGISSSTPKYNWKGKTVNAARKQEGALVNKKL